MTTKTTQTKNEMAKPSKTLSQMAKESRSVARKTGLTKKQVEQETQKARRAFYKKVRR